MRRFIYNTYSVVAIFLLIATGIARADWYSLPQTISAVPWGGTVDIAIEDEYVVLTTDHQDFATLVQKLNLPVSDILNLGSDNSDAFYSTAPASEIYSWQSMYSSYFQAIDPNIVIFPIEPPGGLVYRDLVLQISADVLIPEPSSSCLLVFGAIPLLFRRQVKKQS